MGTTVVAFLPPSRLDLFGPDVSYTSTKISVSGEIETQAVPDSVDPLVPIFQTQSESSFLSQPQDGQTNETQQRGSQNSILVAETPDRLLKQPARALTREHTAPLVGDKSRVDLHTSSEAEDQVDIGLKHNGALTTNNVCRFHFFPAKTSRQTVRIPREEPVADVPAVVLQTVSSPEPTDLQQSGRGFMQLPVMNVRDATQISLGDQDESTMSVDGVGAHSILPPPVLHFSLAKVTSLMSIYRNPSQYTGQPFGRISDSVNLLVVVKEVADVSRVRARFPVDHPRPRTGNAREYGRNWDDGRTDRVELVVLDGQMQPGPPPQAVAHKHMFRIVLWGNLARQWTTEPDQSMGPALSSAKDLSGSRSASLYIASSREPTALRAGDVIYIENVSLSSPSPSDGTGSKRPRLGAGFPPRATSHLLTLMGNGSEHKSTSIELCYRTDLLHRTDHAHNFDADIAYFDPKSRRVLELSRLYTSSHVRSHLP